MDIYILAILSVVIVADIILGLIVVSRGVKSYPDVMFGLITLTLILWSISIIGFYSGISFLDISWVALTHSSAILISYFFFVFSTHFPQKIFKSNLVITLSSLPLLLILAITFLTSNIVGKINGVRYELGSLYIVYASLLVIFFFFGFIFLLLQYKKATDTIQKKQVLYVLAGYFISSTLAIIPDLIFPYFNVFQYTWLGPIFALILVTALFIAIVRYKLFQVKVIVTEILSIVIVIALLIELFFVADYKELILKTVVLVIITCFSYLLIKGVNKEITQRQHIELLATDLQKANDRLTELDRQKSEFVSFATHQLRAPLTAMKGYASLILEGDMGTITDATREAISRIFDSSKTLANIVDDYLNITRIELGSMKYAFETISLSALIEDVIGELKPTIEKSKLDFSFTMDVPGANYRVTADRDKLKQVITNLLDNSMKYTPSGWIKVSLTMDRPRHLFVFAIKDSGIGISAETIPLLFQKFGRAHNANKVNIKGTGLGLFVAKEIIAAHHGTVRVESEGEGKGSTFIVELEPFAKA